MSYTKEKIYNLTLSALLLTKKEVVNVNTDTSTEVRALNIHWDVALESTLKDLDLDCLSQEVVLALIEELEEGPWQYVYTYPANCAKLRRLVSGAIIDNKRTHISKRIALYDGDRAIYTNEYDASAEVINTDIDISVLPPMAGMALVYKLAYLSAPLVVGKGSQKLRDDLQKAYIIAKTEAQEDDATENMNFESDDIRSEFVDARLE